MQVSEKIQRLQESKGDETTNNLERVTYEVQSVDSPAHEEHSNARTGTNNEWLLYAKPLILRLRPSSLKNKAVLSMRDWQSTFTAVVLYNIALALHYQGLHILLYSVASSSYTEGLIASMMSEQNMATVTTATNNNRNGTSNQGMSKRLRARALYRQALRALDSLMVVAPQSQDEPTTCAPRNIVLTRTLWSFVSLADISITPSMPTPPFLMPRISKFVLPR